MYPVSELEQHNLRIAQDRVPNTHGQEDIQTNLNVERSRIYENPEASGLVRKERADPADDKYWDYINDQSGAKVWQRVHGVLWRITRAVTSEGNKSAITASNVRQSDLILQYGWKFINLKTSPGPISKRIGNEPGIHSSFKTVRTRAQKILKDVVKKTLVIPDSWPVP